MSTMTTSDMLAYQATPHLIRPALVAKFRRYRLARRFLGSAVAFRFAFSGFFK